MKITSTKRGDTIIEVMFAIAIFGLVAILSISAMNRGLNSAETTLEETTAREELNAQAEALRFVYEGGNALWNTLTSKAVDLDDADSDSIGMLHLSDFVMTPSASGVTGCDKLYSTSSGRSPLQKVNAFVLNTRRLSTGRPEDSYVEINSGPNLFQPSPLGARILYGLETESANAADNGALSDSGMEVDIKRAEGIWAFAVEGIEGKNGQPSYYDFYVQACWYGPGAGTPTVLDTVMRLTTPGAR